MGFTETLTCYCCGYLENTRKLVMNWENRQEQRKDVSDHFNKWKGLC